MNDDGEKEAVRDGLLVLLLCFALMLALTVAGQVAQ